jgi:hypothetical protein
MHAHIEREMRSMHAKATLASTVLASTHMEWDLSPLLAGR